MQHLKNCFIRMKFLKVLIIGTILIAGTEAKEKGTKPGENDDKVLEEGDVTTEISGDEDDEYIEYDGYYDEYEDDGEDEGDGVSINKGEVITAEGDGPAEKVTNTTEKLPDTTEKVKETTKNETTTTVVVTIPEVEEKLNFTAYEYFEDYFGTKETERLEEQEANLKEKIDEEKNKTNTDQAKIDKLNATLINVTDKKEFYLNFKSNTLPPRKKFISQHDHFMNEIKAVKTKFENMTEGEAKLALEKVFENGTKEMETIYLPIKNLMIEEMKIMNNLTRIFMNVQYYDNDQEKEAIDELEDELRPKIKEITIYLNSIKYKSRSRLLIKAEKFKIDEDDLQIKLDDSKKKDNETATALLKLELDLKKEKSRTVEKEVKIVVLQ